MTEAARKQLDELYRFQADAVTRSLSRRVGQHNAEDIVSQAFIKLAEKLEHTSIRDAPALLGTIIAGLEKDFYRGRDARGEVLIAPEEFQEPDQLGNLGISHALTYEDQHFTTGFDSAVRRLEGVDRDAFVLTELRGLTVREAADVLDTSKDTVHRRAEAARTSIGRGLRAA